MLSKIRKEHPRLTNHLLLVIVTLLGVGIAALFAAADQLLVETLSLATGYEALFLVLLTLLIGPLNMLRQRRNPVNLNFRRDAGIWAGFTAITHVIFSFQIYFGGNLLAYFFTQDDSGLTPQLNLFGISNYVGLFAALVIVFLLVISNNYFLKRLKGKRWKNWQRFNYLLFGLALLHTLGQQISNSRGFILTWLVLVFSFAVLVAQSVGFMIYRQRSQQRKTATVQPQAASREAEKSVQPGQIQPAGSGVVGRRRFIGIAGAAILAGFAGGLTISPLLIKASQETLNQIDGNTTPETVASTTTQPSVAATSPVAAASPTSTVSSATATSTTSAATATPSATATSPATVASTSPTTASAAATAPTTAKATATAAPSSGTVLAALSALPVGTVKQFTTPDSKETAFLVREADGSVKAFSGICTHEPFKLVYNQSIKQLYCSKHGACFSTVDGSVTQRPARTGLASLTVKVDGQGNIVYSAS